MMAMTTKSSIRVKARSRAELSFITPRVRWFVERNTKALWILFSPRRIRLVDRFPVMTMRFFLYLGLWFVVGRFAPGLFLVHQFLQRSRGVVTRCVKPSRGRRPEELREAKRAERGQS